MQINDVYDSTIKIPLTMDRLSRVVSDACVGVHVRARVRVCVFVLFDYEYTRIKSGRSTIEWLKIFSPETGS